MGDKLVIVESPAKAKTIQKYLGQGFKVTASMGHVRDLPKNGLAIDLEHDFAPAYEVTKEKVVSELRRAARQADAVYLATDPDREGEAIAWHIMQAIGIPRTTPTHRVVFQEITPTAVKAAIANPRRINADLVNAQQARRVLDRLVGYQLSPLLWDKVKRGLSAGRVQSVAVRLIVEREEQIEAFKPVEYWTIEVDLQKLAGTVANGKANPVFRATLIERAGKKLDKFALGNQEAAQAIVTDLDRASYTVSKIARRDKKRSPSPPFTTSTLQQEAGRKLGFSARKTMTLAQQLYEGIDIGGSEGTVGLITYMRTDSTNIAQDAQQEAREVIHERYGSDYLPDKPPIYKTKARGAQEAHEAIRPTSSQRHPDQLARVLERDLLRLYDLIWKRFLASQMAPAIFDSTTVDIAATRPHDAAGTIPYLFRATGSVVKFAGFLAVYNEGLDEGEEDENSERRLPLLREAEQLNLIALLPIQHFTEPPPRYTEASLVKDLERLGIGRPSTYAPIISTIQERGYVELVEKKLIPTMLGRVVTRLLVEHFPEIIGYEFTSTLEQKLDDIALGEARWVPVLHEFYTPFSTLLEQARHEMRNVKQDEILTGITCPKCQQGELAVKFGRNGEFLSCTRYDRKGGADSCDFTSNFQRTAEGQIVLEANSSPELSDVMCNVCGRPMVQKKGRFGTFLGCSGYPECTNTRRLGKDGKPVPLPEPTGITCPKCHEGELLKRRGKFGRPFFSCGRYPACDYAAATMEEVERAIADPATIPVTTPKPSSTAAATPTTKTPAKRTATKRSSNGTTAATSTAATPTKSGSTTAKKPRARSKKKAQE
ncbi:MAG: type I DNA topoisomerase [Chloroflexaceae bacterium]|nr:type I DNA topoisomerase [Chloroflexaceae bacterium]